MSACLQRPVLLLVVSPPCMQGVSSICSTSSSCLAYTSSSFTFYKFYVSSRYYLVHTSYTISSLYKFTLYILHVSTCLFSTSFSFYMSLYIILQVLLVQAIQVLAFTCLYTFYKFYIHVSTPQSTACTEMPVQNCPITSSSVGSGSGSWFTRSLIMNIGNPIWIIFH